jgi:hypothetical protein
LSRNLRMGCPVTTYAERLLTNGSDVLNGFSRVLSLIERKPSEAFFWGLEEQWFDDDLCCRRSYVDPSYVDPSMHRESVNTDSLRTSPTWSWLAWRGKLFPPERPDTEVRSSSCGNGILCFALSEHNNGAVLLPVIKLRGWLDIGLGP